MDLSSVAALASETSKMQTGDAVGLRVLKSAMKIQAQSVQSLIAALPKPNNPPNLGNAVDLKA